MGVFIRVSVNTFWFIGWSGFTIPGECELTVSVKSIFHFLWKNRVTNC